MKQFRAFIRKEFYHILRDTRTMLILLVLPIVLIILLGFAMSTELKNVRIAFMADHYTEEVRQIVERVNANPGFQCDTRIFTTEEGISLMQANKIDGVIRFGRERPTANSAMRSGGMQIIVDASNPNIAESTTIFLRGIVETQRTASHTNNATVNGETQYIASLQMRMPTIKLLYNPRMKSSFNFVPGIMGLILLLICAMMTSISIVREKEMGTMEVLLTSPVRPIYMIVAKMVPYFLVSCVNIATVLCLAKFVLDVPLAGSIGLILCFSLLYTFMSLGIGLLVSTVASSQTTAILVCAVVMMIPVMMLSGMMFPIDSMPLFFQWLSHVVPARWYIHAMRCLMIEGLPFAYVQTDFLVLCGMTIAFIGIALKKFNNRLE